jgi:HAD superfamily hydrolase (TIGR01549 family)
MSPTDHSAWLVDLDGTLYHARPVKVAMAAELLGGHWGVVPVLRRFRQAHEQLRHLPLHECDDAPFQRQLKATAEASGQESHEVERVVTEWMCRRPGKWLRLFRRRSLLREIADFRAAGGRTALVSDYPARLKLVAMRVEDLFDTVVANGEAGGPRQVKPHPEGYLLAAERLNVLPAVCLVIGDRSDADGEAARQAGMAFRRV